MAYYQIITNITNSISNMDYFLFNAKTWCYTFSEGRKPDSASNMTKFHRFANLLNLPVEVAAQPLLGYLSISGVLELQIKWDWTRWKVNISSYNIYEKPSLNSIIFRPESSLKSRWWICPVFVNSFRWIFNYPHFPFFSQNNYFYVFPPFHNSS